MSKSAKNINNNKLMSISELANQLLIEKHTLRFWENKFKQIKPIVLSRRRYYSKKEVELINLIKFLLKEQGLTIEGTRKILNKNINTLDHYKTSSITSSYYKTKIKKKSKALLEKIKNLKK